MALSNWRIAGDADALILAKSQDQVLIGALVSRESPANPPEGLQRAFGVITNHRIHSSSVVTTASSPPRKANLYPPFSLGIK